MHKNNQFKLERHDEKYTLDNTINNTVENITHFNNSLLHFKDSKNGKDDHISVG